MSIYPTRPKLNREQRRNTKLSSDDLIEISYLRKNGMTIIELGEKFNVSPQCIFYWVRPENERKAINKTKICLTSPEKARQISNNYRKYRKSLVAPLELRKIERDIHRIWSENNRERRNAISLKSYYKKK